MPTKPNFVFLKKSLFYCFNNFGDCPEEGFPSLRLISCIEENITKNECKRLYNSQCGVEFGCSIPSICKDIKSPWCTNENENENETHITG